METNPSLNIYNKIRKMKVEPVEEPKGGLLSKTMSTKGRKYHLVLLFRGNLLHMS